MLRLETSDCPEPAQLRLVPGKQGPVPPCPKAPALPPAPAASPLPLRDPPLLALVAHLQPSCLPARLFLGVTAVVPAAARQAHFPSLPVPPAQHWQPQVSWGWGGGGGRG